MRIVTNFVRFPRRWTDASGLDWETVEARTSAEFLARTGSGETLWLVNCDPRLTLELAWKKRPGVKLVAVDLVLRQARNWRDRVRQPVQRVLLGRVDHFIHYFRDCRGYEKHFGIGPERSSFVPFKVNLVDRHQVEASPEGEYVLCLGQSMRDFDTFFSAMERLPYPAAISEPNLRLLAEHGSRFTRALDALPGNVRILRDDRSEEAMIGIIRGAKMLALPVLKTSMVSSGISIGLNAMSLGKCVIGTHGPGMTDVFTNGELLLAEPENAESLATVIAQAWEDGDLRRRTAEAGYRYAKAVGGEGDLYERVLRRLEEWLRG